MITQQHGKALGTSVVFTLGCPPKEAESLLAELRQYLHDFENRFSRFLTDSELTRHNLGAGTWQPASKEFIDFARLSNNIQEVTNGLYNPFILPDLQRHGYLNSFTGTHGNETILDMRQRHAVYREARMGIRGNKVRIAPDMAFDSGGLGKGYALDELADIIESHGLLNYWISLGGDIIGRGADDQGNPWSVSLDMISGKPVILLSADRRAAVVTSSILSRRGDTWHHIIDPRTCQPAKTPIQSASVVADSAAAADITVTCLIIAGSKATEYWRHHQAQAAYIQTADGMSKL